MIWEVVEEARQIMREMPGFTATFLVLMVLCIGVRCAVFYEADGDHFKLIADRHHQQAHLEGKDVFETTDAISRMRARIACPMKIPGFTLIVGWRQLDMEVSVPITSVTDFFEDAHMDVVMLFTHTLPATA